MITKLLEWIIGKIEYTILLLRNVQSNIKKQDVNMVLDSESNMAVSVTKHLNLQMLEEKPLFLVQTFKLPQNREEKIDFWRTWISTHITYITDLKKFGTKEKWENLNQILKTNSCDCEEGSMLLYVLLRHSGFKREELRIVCGNLLNGQGHAWLRIKDGKHNVWRIVDWCYNPNFRPFNEQSLEYNSPYYAKIWFSFDEQRCYRI